jgi:serine protease
MALGAHVLVLDRPLPAAEADALVARLAQYPDVEYVQRDRRRRAQQRPNDTYVNGQTYLENAPGGISAFAAWDVTTGSGNVVVAIVDSGYRPHADLAGRILPGYDFIFDPKTANDGDGRDTDAADPGDWINATDKTDPEFADCDIEDSAWHGTNVAGVVAANTNNGQWTAGINWAAKILPVRVLGKCGGYDSDIIDGVAWAAGLTVPGVPANPNPAQVINMSLGGEGECLAAYHSVFSAALAHGVTRAIVVAAGNDAADVVNDSPANCSEVIAVASTTTQGSLASYSNFGTGIALSAPGGQYNVGLGNDGIFVLSNLGATSPAGDTIRISGGTSLAATMVTGVASLILGVAPHRTAAEIRALLTATAKPFPVVSDCTTNRCGAGIVDAYAAVLAAQSVTPPPAALDLNQHGLSGSWYEPATSGQGVEVEVFPNLAGPGTGVLQVSWFTFDSAIGGAERQRWYTLGGSVATGAASASLAIFQNVGGNFNAPPITMGHQVGSTTLSFTACDKGKLDYVFSDGTGRTGSIPLTRLTQNVTCSTTTARPVNADFAFSGNWYDPATAGQGFTVEINPLSLAAFFAWYTYAPSSAAAGAAGQRWYTGQSTYTAGARTLAMTLSETTGGLFDAPSTPPPNSVAVGAATLVFQSCTAATLTFNFTGGSSAGASGTIALARVGPVPPGCTL